MLSVVMILYGLFTLIPKTLLLTSREIYDVSESFAGTMTAGGLLVLPIEVQIAVGFLASLVTIVAAIFIWRGRNWARWAVVLWMLFSLLLYFLQTGIAWLGLIKLPVFFLVLFLLFRPQAAAHFR